MRYRHMHFQKIPRSKKKIWSHPVCQGVFWDAESRGHHLMLTCQAVSFSVLQRFWFFRSIFTWNSKQPVLYGCFNWMIQNLYIGNGCFTKHPFINGWPWSSRYIYIYIYILVISPNISQMPRNPRDLKSGTCFDFQQPLRQYSTSTCAPSRQTWKFMRFHVFFEERIEHFNYRK